MKLSIITINFNNKAGLQKTIDSIVSQTWRDFEWIVVDGGSTDGSKELIEKYAQQGCFAWWCSEPDKGVYNAMNKGISHAKGEYLNFMNSGDIYHNEKSLKLVFEEKIFTTDIIYGNYNLCTEDRIIEEKHQPENLDLRYLFHNSINHQSSFIKTKLLNVFPYNENFKIVSDRLWFLQAMLRGNSFGYIDQTISNFYIGGISSNSNVISQEMEFIKKVYIPHGIVELINQLDFIEKECLWNPVVVSCYHLIHTRRLYKRIITQVLRILAFFEK